MRQTKGKEFEVIVEGRRRQVKLEIIAPDAASAKKLAEPVRERRRLGRVIEVREKPESPKK